MNFSPLISVIVPVRNGERTIDKLIEALLAQDYPQDKTEIIIVDNDSKDQTVEIIKKYPVILEQEKRLHSSYAARNKGLTVAKGEIIAFTDADCIPESDWISMGIKGLREQSADVAGGRIKFILSGKKSAAGYFDLLNNLRNDHFIHSKIGAVTANLFVNASLFGQIGLFPEVQSGGDINWTGKAMSKGYSLIYVPQAVVYHPTRNFAEILRKSRLRGTGLLLTLKQRSWWFIKILYLISRWLIPIPDKIIIQSLIGAKRNTDIKKKRLAIWGISYLCQLSLIGGLTYSVFRNIFKNSGNNF